VTRADDIVGTGTVADLRQRLRDSIASVLGAAAIPDEPAMFKPHISVTYCHAETEAASLRQRLEQLRSIPPINIEVTDVTLIVTADRLRANARSCRCAYGGWRIRPGRGYGRAP
jgi:2'-5' RNA ligase